MRIAEIIEEDRQKKEQGIDNKKTIGNIFIYISLFIITIETLKRVI